VPGTGNVIAELPPEEEVEADTGAQEDAGDLNSILLPNGVLPSDVFQFSVSYKQAAFDGYVGGRKGVLLRGQKSPSLSVSLVACDCSWVKQHSPACAAASIAGAWNIIHGYRYEGECILCEPWTVVLMTVLSSPQPRSSRRAEPRHRG